MPILESLRAGLPLALVVAMLVHCAADPSPSDRSEVESSARAPMDRPAEEAYSVVPGWPVLAPDVVLGEASGVGVDSHGHVFLFDRGAGASILGLDPADGRVVVRFGQGVFANLHGLAIGPNDEARVTDTLRHRVLRFSHAGELLQTLGE